MHIQGSVLIDRLNDYLVFHALSTVLKPYHVVEHFLIAF